MLGSEFGAKRFTFQPENRPWTLSLSFDHQRTAHVKLSQVVVSVNSIFVHVWSFVKNSRSGIRDMLRTRKHNDIKQVVSPELWMRLLSCLLETHLWVYACVKFVKIFKTFIRYAAKTKVSWKTNVRIHDMCALRATQYVYICMCFVKNVRSAHHERTWCTSPLYNLAKLLNCQK